MLKFSMIVLSGPVFTTGAGFRVTTIDLESAGQYVLPVVVNVRLAFPLFMSDTPGKKVALRFAPEGEKFPLPFVFQMPPVALDTAPFKTRLSLEQIAVSLPAIATGAAANAILTDEKFAGQAPLFVVVNVKRTEPAVLSELDGLYPVFKFPLDGEKIPEPLLVQIPVLLPPVTVPPKLIVGDVMQTV